MYDCVCVWDTLHFNLNISFNFNDLISSLVQSKKFKCVCVYLFNHILGTTQKLAKPEKNRQKPPFGDIPICKTLKSPEIHCHLTLHGTVGLIWIDFELDFQTIV